MAPPTVDWSFPHQSSIRKMSSQLAHKPFWWRQFLNWWSFSDDLKLVSSWQKLTDAHTFLIRFTCQFSPNSSQIQPTWVHFVVYIFNWNLQFHLTQKGASLFAQLLHCTYFLFPSSLLLLLPTSRSFPVAKQLHNCSSHCLCRLNRVTLGSRWDEKDPS